MDYISKYSGEEIEHRLDLAGEAYQKPVEGIPATDMSEQVQKALERAGVYVVIVNETRYEDIAAAYDSGKNVVCKNGTEIMQLVDAYGYNENFYFASINNGIVRYAIVTPENEWEIITRQVYSKPSGGIPKSDLAQDVQNSLENGIEVNYATIDSMTQEELSVIYNKLSQCLGNMHPVFIRSGSVRLPAYLVTSTNGFQLRTFYFTPINAIATIESRIISVNLIDGVYSVSKNIYQKSI